MMLYATRWRRMAFTSGSKRSAEAGIGGAERVDSGDVIARTGANLRRDKRRWSSQSKCSLTFLVLAGNQNAENRLASSTMRRSSMLLRLEKPEEGNEASTTAGNARPL